MRLNSSSVRPRARNGRLEALDVEVQRAAELTQDGHQLTPVTPQVVDEHCGGHDLVRLDAQGVEDRLVHEVGEVDIQGGLRNSGDVPIDRVTPICIAMEGHSKKWSS